MNKTCYLCKSKNIKKIKTGVRDNSEIDVYKCFDCGLEFLSNFETMNDEFYENGSMHAKASLEEWINSTQTDDIRRANQLKTKIKNKKVLDFGCGNGGFLLATQNITQKTVGVELDNSLNDYFRRMELKVFNSIEEIEEKFDYITMFHVLEHLKNPEEILNKLSKYLTPNGEILIEVPNSSDILLNLQAFKDFTYWSCHVFGYNEKTLKLLINKTNLTAGTTKHFQRYPYTNHLGWILNKKPGGHKKYLKFKLIDFIYTSILKTLKKTDTVIISTKSKPID